MGNFKEISDALESCLISPNECDRNGEPANIVDGLFAIARGLNFIGESLERLGLSDACTGMGAIEVLSKEVKNLEQGLSNGLIYLADALAKED